jgi:hypothetical protein
MLSAIEQFRENIVRVRALGGLTQALVSMTTAAIDSSDILRAQYVLAVSALDHYVHEVARLGMLDMFDGKRPPSAAYLRFRISLNCMGPGQVISRSDVEAEIRSQHSFVAFQRPDKVADGIRLISEVKLWDAVAARIGQKPELVKQQLSLVVERRNKIAHEADLDPTYPKTRWPISAADVNGVVDFLVDVVEAIHLEIS